MAGVLGTVFAMLLPTVVSALTAFYGLLTVVLLTPLVAGLYSKIPSATAAFTTMAVSVVGEVIIHFSTNGKGWWIFNPIALGIFVGVATMAVMCVLAPNRSKA